MNTKSICPHLLLKLYNGHPPLAEKDSDMRKFSHFAMLRDPVRRFVSLYYYNDEEKHCKTCSHKAKEPINIMASEHLVNKDHSGFAGCMTKMLVGRGCKSSYPSKGEVIIAKRRLEQFTFVGFTDDWAYSICKMNQMFGYPTHINLIGKVRATNYYSDTDKEVDRLRNASIKGGYYDWADAEVFNFARTFFNFTHIPPA